MIHVHVYYTKYDIVNQSACSHTMNCNIHMLKCKQVCVHGIFCLMNVWSVLVSSAHVRIPRPNRVS